MTEDRQSIPATVLENVERFGDDPAIVDGEIELTYAQLGAAVRGAAAAMIAHDVEPGDRVAIWAPNRHEWVVAALGLQSAGAVLVPVNTRFKGNEASYILGRSEAKLLVAATGFLDIDPLGMLATHRDELRTLERIVVLGDDAPEGTTGWADFLASGEAVEAATVDDRVAGVAAEDLSDVLFTSGTTGQPKGVMMTHAQTLRQFNDWCDMVELRAGDRYCIVNPFFHMFGYKAGWLASLLRGATIFPVAIFDVDEVLDIVSRHRITVLPGPPTLYQSILDHPATATADCSSLRVAVTGAADIPVELIRRMHTELPFETIVTGYGLTEAGTVSATRPGDDFETIATTVGTARPGLEVRVVGQDGASLDAGETGELCVRGYSVMRGYYDDPEATQETIDADGWLHTGDLATLDGRGYLRIVGRSKDMFIVGGFNAYPAEIENMLLAHPGVGQVAVIGVPDERMGEVGMAFVVPRTGSEVDPDELIAWSRTEMANYKVPRHVRVVDALPVNATGKVVKEDLRSQVADLFEG